MNAYFLKRTKRNPNTGCVEWIAGRDYDGYGIAYDGIKSIRAHRFSYALFVGRIPSGKWVLHHCDNPPCVNPEHLFLGTAKTNAEDCSKKHRRPNYNGELNPAAKITRIQALEIRARYKPYVSGSHMYDLASEFGISATSVHAIIHGDKWKSLP